jgi:NAD(P)H-dependent FMN reductase
VIDVVTRYMRILGVSGSLRAASTNTRLLIAATKFVPPGVDIHVTTRIAKLPLFNPDTAPEDLDKVEPWIQEVRASDGIIVSRPEYARGYPGALKNALDWLARERRDLRVTRSKNLSTTVGPFRRTRSKGSMTPAVEGQRSSRTQMFLKLIGGLGSPCACSLIGTASCA